MKKFGFAPSFTVIVCVAVFGIGALSAYGRAQYSKQFIEKYCDPKSEDANTKKLAAAVATAKCNTCHVGTKKADRNNYGKELSKLLGKNEKAKDKIEKALDDAAQIKVDDKDPNSKTYGDLLKEGLLPGGAEEKK